MLAQAVTSLQENEQIVLSLYYEKNLHMKEIAQVMGVSEGPAVALDGEETVADDGEIQGDRCGLWDALAVVHRDLAVGPNVAMKEIAQVMGVSEPRISQIHSRAIQKLSVPR